MIVLMDQSKRRIRWVFVGTTIFAFLVLGRAFSIQILTDNRLEKMARRQFQSKVLLSPKRGPILDRNGEALAVNVDTNSLAANPMKIRKQKSVLRLLAHALKMTIEKLRQKMSEKREFTWIKRHLTESEMNFLKKSQIIAADGDLVEGLWLVRESKRVYPHHELAAHILGDTNIDNEGLEGIELWQNTHLKGKVVSVETTRDAMGRPTFLDASVASSVKDGESVRLTIDSSLQYSVQQELKQSVKKTGSRGGVVIVMNAVSGEILAMANEPSFDANQPGTAASVRRNRSLTDGYEPGSTLKPVLLASALSQGMHLNDQIWANRGSISIQGKRISEAEAHEKFEWVSLKKMIQVSSNVAAAKLALKVGADNYLKSLQSLGYGLKTGVGFPGEISGIVPPLKVWKPLTLANIGFGQGILVTPIQMVRAYAAFLNGGWLIDPVLVLAETDAKRPAPRRVLTPTVAEGVLSALSAVTENGGTGTKAVLDGYSVAGKTGTAQTIDPLTGRYSRSKYISSFIGFATNIDPKIVIYTSLDSPQGVYYASETAAPLFRSVLASVVNRFSIPPDTRLVQQKTSDFENRLTVHDAMSTTQAHVERPIIKKPIDRNPSSSSELQGESSESSLPWKVPSVIGLTAREALRALQGRPYEVKIYGQGVVRSQYPEPGKDVADRTTIRLSLASP